MNKSQNSLYPEDWKKAAQKDWLRVRLLLNENDAEGAAYFLQQALEKYLKAFLLERGWNLKKTHELDSLLDEAITFEPKLAPYIDLCERVSGYYFTERYPTLDHIEMTSEDLEEDIEKAQKLIEFLSGN
jgi:HEPN domain-containing protein